MTLISTADRPRLTGYLNMIGNIKNVIISILHSKKRYNSTP